MKRERKKPSSGSWMDTYGDMVTLLLCFFVLLYSISTVDQTKYMNLVKSINPNYELNAESPMGSTGETESLDVAAFDQMYENLVREFDSYGLDAEVDVVKGDGYNFIAFRDEVFFDGDSYLLREEGKVALDAFARAIADAAPDIKEIQVLGHTSQALPDKENVVVTDRMLSSERAAQITAYIQSKNLVSPARLVSVGYGQFRPIAPFDTEENRAKNRRVEILITNEESVEKSLTEYYAQVYGEDVAKMQFDAQ